MTVAGPISVLMVIFKPLSAVLNFLSGIMTKLTGGKEDKPSVTEEELKYLVESIEEEGGAGGNRERSCAFCAGV